ncbi:MAG: trypsin-like peptidase domain-containing protein [Acidimicrobiales bacterium]
MELPPPPNAPVSPGASATGASATGPSATGPLPAGPLPTGPATAAGSPANPGPLGPWAAPEPSPPRYRTEPLAPTGWTGTAKAPPTVRPGRWAALTTVLALAAGGVGGLVGATVADNGAPSPANPTAGPAATLAPRPISPGGGDVGDLVVAVERSVVSIRTGQGAGTGLVLTADGEVLTNAHVIDGARQLSVNVAGENQSRRVDLIDSYPEGDLALLKIRDASGLTPARLGRSSELRPGDDVVAIGNALGLRGDPSVTRGIVSALGRSVDSLTGMIQTDAAINPGNSGGPLINTAGEVVGINTAVRGGAQNIGFAIPIDTAMEFVERARKGEPAPVGAFLGIRSEVPADGSPGADLVTVDEGSAAADAGLLAGDRIVAVGSQPVAGPAELGGLIRARRPGEKVALRILRNGDEQDITITLGQRIET